MNEHPRIGRLVTNTMTWLVVGSEKLALILCYVIVNGCTCIVLIC